MTNNTLQVIESRRSQRSYTAQQLSSEQLDALMTAAMQSPSALDKQPWHFSFVQDKELLARISQAAHKQAARLPEGQRSPRFSNPDFHVFYKAPTVVFISTPAGESGVDCGIAVQTLALAAKSMGLGSVIIALSRLAFDGEDRVELEKALDFPTDYRLVISIAIGTSDDEKAAHAMNRNKISLIK